MDTIVHGQYYKNVITIQPFFNIQNPPWSRSSMPSSNDCDVTRAATAR